MGMSSILSGTSETCPTNGPGATSTAARMLEAQDRAGRLADDVVGLGPQPPERRMHDAAADDHKIGVTIERRLADHGAHGSGGNRRLETGSGFGLQLGHFLAGGIQKEQAELVAAGVGKLTLRTRDGMHQTQARAELLCQFRRAEEYRSLFGAAIHSDH